MEERFRPAIWARNPHLQTLFASLRIRTLGPNPMRLQAQEMIIPAVSGGRLLGYRSRQPRGQTLGQVILLHGWEGSADSAYILAAGRFFYGEDYDVFRLNLRDHGLSHHLNPGLFHGALTEEVATAIAHICELSPCGPNFLIGFSLGGNFALRMALRHRHTPFPNLSQVFAVSPALDPLRTTERIDQGLALYRRYFLSKWKRSLRIKQRLFPELYRFDQLLHYDSCLSLTEAMLVYFQEFSSLRDYFGHYTLSAEMLTQVGLPTTIIAAKDDPVVGIEDLRVLKEEGFLRLLLTRWGGHCGFLDPFPWGCWTHRVIAGRLSA